MDILALLDKLLDMTSIPEAKQDRGKAFVKHLFVAAYDGAVASGKDAEAVKIKEVAMTWAGMVEPDFDTFMDPVAVN